MTWPSFPAEQFKPALAHQALVKQLRKAATGLIYKHYSLQKINHEMRFFAGI